MIAAKPAALADAVARIQRRWGSEVLTSGSALPLYRPSALPTGIAALDELLGGGLPRGHLTLLEGPPSSGIRTLLWHALAQAQKGRELVALLDLGRSFDAAYAQGCGVQLPNLLVVHPRGVAEALAITVALIRTGLTAVIDSVGELALEGAGLLIRGLRQLVPHVQAQHTAVVLLAPLGPSAWVGTATHAVPVVAPFAGARLHCQRQQWLGDEEVTGFRTEVTVRKHPQRSSEGRSVSVALALALRANP